MYAQKPDAAGKRAARAHRKRETAQEAKIRAARADGHQWAQIARDLKITEGQARWALQRAQTPQALSRGEGQEPRTGPRPGRGPGVGVSTAARILRVSRRTIYAWIRTGRLQATQNELGQTRLLLDHPLEDPPLVSHHEDLVAAETVTVTEIADPNPEAAA